MDAPQSDLAAVRRALDAARDSLATGSRDQPIGATTDSGATAAAMGHLLDAVMGIANFLENAAGPGNTGVVDGDMPAGGPKFDRSRPHRGYGRSE
jgi:hypothetical protein